MSVTDTLLAYWNGRLMEPQSVTFRIGYLVVKRCETSDRESPGARHYDYEKSQTETMTAALQAAERYFLVPDGQSGRVQVTISQVLTETVPD